MATFGFGFIGTAQIADNAVTPAKILSGVILQQATHVATTDISTTSGTYVDATGSTLTITTSGAKVLITAIFGAMGSTTWRPIIQLQKDGAEIATSDVMSNDHLGMATYIYLDSPTAGAHTYKFVWKSSSAGNSVVSNASSGDFERIITATEVK